MQPDRPERWPEAFERSLDAGNLDEVVELYAPDAHFVAPSGEVITGRDNIRGVLGRLIETHTHLHRRVIKAIVVDDIAMLYTDFVGTTDDPSGGTMEMRSNAVEILRRQTDGTWKLIVGDPNARAT